MAKTVAQLMAEKTALETRIKEAQKAEKEARKAKAIKALEASGLLELSEAELTEALGGLIKTKHQESLKQLSADLKKEPKSEA